MKDLTIVLVNGRIAYYTPARVSSIYTHGEWSNDGYLHTKFIKFEDCLVLGVL